ncbi:hypothetical protein N2152v2_002332 [Parachlorella kessleri]
MSDSEDDVPLGARQAAMAPIAAPNGLNRAPEHPKVPGATASEAAGTKAALANGTGLAPPPEPVGAGKPPVAAAAAAAAPATLAHEAAAPPRPPQPAAAAPAVKSAGAPPKPVVPPKGRVVIQSDSDSEADLPLAARKASASKPATAARPVSAARPAAAAPAAAKKPQPAAGAAARKPSAALLDDAVMLPTAPRPKPAPKPALKREVLESDSDSEEDVPLQQRRQSLSGAGKKPATKRVKSESEGDKPRRKRKPAAASDSDGGRAKRSRSGEGGESQNGDEIRWNSLRHHGVMFPPEYTPHGVKILYDGLPVDLTPEQEEVATFFAVMKETDYMQKPIFLKNFWEGFKEILGPRHTIKSLEKCDFTPIYEWHMAERERKKQLTKEEKAALKAEKDAAEAKYKTALVDGKEEPVGNFRVEMPGLFRGRGEHPRMGRIKRRVYPRDITINIGKGEPVPEHPFPGQKWKEVRHDKTVTWLAMWNDPVNTKQFKYVWLAPTSSWKADSDLQKYEKARKLKDYIDDIRATYQRNWESKDRQERQMATALYFIDKLALRAGHEKDEDEADTVGCCTLKVENVECIAPDHIKFDFLGKDSIRYENQVKVEDKVFKNVQLFMRETAGGHKKKPGDQLFDAMDAQDLNKRLKDLMDGLSVKVFRTYNASIVLDQLLNQPTKAETVDAKKAAYDFANKEVAILCNHQRSIPKSHSNAMEKLREKVEGLQSELEDLQHKLQLAEKGKKDEDGKKLNEDRLQEQIERKKAQIMKAELEGEKREALKTVALGTSKINYLDPRITVAWCKRNEVPLEKVFNKSLLAKFVWAMDIEPEFK